MSEAKDGLQFDAGFALPGLSRQKPLDTATTYDVLVLGAGPAGLSASIYLIRKGVKLGIVTGDIGGQVAWTSSIENYLGYRMVEGAELVARFNEQLESFEAAVGLGEKVEGVGEGPEGFEVVSSGGRYSARALVLATGKRPRMLGVPGEKELLGRGVAYCAICDAPLYRGRTTVVVGGGNSGLEGAVDLAKGSPAVFVLERQDRFTGDAVLVRRVQELGNVELLARTEVREIVGDRKVQGVRVVNVDSGEEKVIAAEGVFVEIGLDPNSEALRGFLALNERGEVEVDCAGRTSRPGVFAAGDVTSVPYKQIIIAAGDGAKAALSAYEHLLRMRPSPQGG